ncbi:MAG: DUF6794 domain-containing protein [Thiolinea sp.]
MVNSIRYLLCVLILTFLTACHADPDTSTDAKWPESVEQAVDKMLSELSEQDKQLLRSTDKVGLIQFHKTLGAGIRNSYGLLQGNDALRKSACAIDVNDYYPVNVARSADSESICHPDQASMAIIGMVWEALQ